MLPHPPRLCLLLHVLMYEQLLQASTTCQLLFTLRHVAAVSHPKAVYPHSLRVLCFAGGL